MGLKELREAVAAAFAKMEAAHRAIGDVKPDDEGADLDALQTQFDEAEAAHRAAKVALERAEAVEEARAALPVVPTPDPEPGPSVTVTAEPLTYRKDNAAERSYFRDHVLVEVNGDQEARARLARHAEELRTNPNSTDGQGGEFVPPLWMQQEWVALAKAGRATADACRSMPLPPGTDTINFPTAATGATVATQADAGSVSSTDITTSSQSYPVKTAAGQQDISMQLLDRSIPGFDIVVFEELHGRYAIALDKQVLNGAGSGSEVQGITGLSGINAVTYTSSTPTVALLYSAVANGIQKIHTTRFLPPSAILMHPVRWASILAASDSTGRPLVVPNGDAYNQAAVLSKVAPESIVGGMAGLPVIVDPNIGTTSGAGTNQDTVYIARLEDLWLMEDAPVKTRVLKEVLSGTLQVRIQLYNYFAFATRYPKSICAITGTGLVAPTF